MTERINDIEIDLTALQAVPKVLEIALGKSEIIQSLLALDGDITSPEFKRLQGEVGDLFEWIAGGIKFIALEARGAIKIILFRNDHLAEEHAAVVHRNLQELFPEVPQGERKEHFLGAGIVWRVGLEWDSDTCRAKEQFGRDQPESSDEAAVLLKAIWQKLQAVGIFSVLDFDDAGRPFPKGILDIKD